MIELTVLWFSNATDEDETNYFSGEVYSPSKVNVGDFIDMVPGAYRIIDGDVYRITSGIPHIIEDQIKSIF